MKTKWLTVSQYAKKVGLSRQRIYKKIETGKIPRQNWRRVKITKLFSRIEIFTN